MKNLSCYAAMLLSVASCGAIEKNGTPDLQPDNAPAELSLPGLARMFAELPLEPEHLKEVYDAVGNSSGNGFDEEYTMSCILENPGAGVGDDRLPAGTKARGGYGNPLRNLIRDYLSGRPSTRSSVESLMDALAQSDYQLYWPYSEDWDGVTYPIITFDPGYGAESNYGFELSVEGGELRVKDSVYVDEAVAMRRPVWVLNSNSDAAFTPMELFEKVSGHSYAAAAPEPDGISPAARPRKLTVKTFKMLRNYDTWFCGASEFWIKCGSVEGFTASTEAELKLYSPSITEFIIVVQRRYVGKELPFDAILVSDFSTQLDKLAFLITEDDGGTRTSWKCEATVKIQSKSYGFTIDLPMNIKDDIVWRGQLSARFFEEEDIVTGRFGDVVISFELD